MKISTKLSLHLQTVRCRFCICRPLVSDLIPRRRLCRHPFYPLRLVGLHRWIVGLHRWIKVDEKERDDHRVPTRPALFFLPTNEHGAKKLL